MSLDLVVRGFRVALPSGVQPAAIHVAGGRIARIAELDDVPRGAEAIDAGDLVVMPGLVDAHVHVNEPGRTEWEGFPSATRAAAAGGVTTIVDMPLNSVPATVTVAGLEAKRRATGGRCFVDVGFWGGLVPGNAAELGPLADAGVLGFKCFLTPSGVEEFPHVTDVDLRAALPRLAAAGATLLAHAELPDRLRPAARGDDPRRYATYLATRPPEAERDAAARLIRLCRQYSAPIHIVHVSSAGTVPLIAAARRDGLPLTAETCPHYLCFAAEDIPDGATAFKCAPPIRETSHRESLWRALRDGVLQMIASDHSPAPPSMKCPETGDFVRAWGGIASLQLSLPIVWTEASARGYRVSDLVRWMSEAPAYMAGLAGRKGRLEAGFDADLAIWDPDQSFTVEAAALEHRHPVTPYAGRVLRGAVKTTILRGRTVYDRGRFPAGPAGHLLGRERRHA